MHAAAGLNTAATAAIDADITTIAETSRLGFEIDHTRSSIAILRRQCASEQIDRISDMRIERRAKAGNTLRHDYPVETVLEIAVFIANMDRAITVKRNAWSLQKHLHQTAISAARLAFEHLAINPVITRTKCRLNCIARTVELGRGNDDLLRRRIGLCLACRLRIGLLCLGSERRKQGNDRASAKQVYRSHEVLNDIL